MRKPWFWLFVAVGLGLVIDFILFIVVPTWAKANSVSIINFFVTVWLIGVTRWAYIPQGDLARKQLDELKTREGEKKKGKIEIIKFDEDPDSTIWIKNNGEVEITEINFEFLPMGGYEMPNFAIFFSEEKFKEKKEESPFISLEDVGGYLIDILRPDEELKIAEIQYFMGMGETHFQVKVYWKDPSGKRREFAKTIE